MAWLSWGVLIAGIAVCVTYATFALALTLLKLSDRAALVALVGAVISGSTAAVLSLVAYERIRRLSGQYVSAFLIWGIIAVVLTAGSVPGFILLSNPDVRFDLVGLMLWVAILIAAAFVYWPRRRQLSLLEASGFWCGTAITCWVVARFLGLV